MASVAGSGFLLNLAQLCAVSAALEVAVGGLNCPSGSMATDGFRWFDAGFDLPIDASAASV